ncbi:hypothetical protein FGO68_gene5559 [Halteria grandinella]|uniref:Uncharacterized protein n=1 Tax=Halteria grandinella TaxID=5974 RepID=A0A8J8NGQ6_HALGN|nr:hypothetical protein FGO68_gene5559 [Halteria grandinella]
MLLLLSDWITLRMSSEVILDVARGIMWAPLKVDWIQLLSLFLIQMASYLALTLILGDSCCEIFGELPQLYLVEDEESLLDLIM